MYNISLATCAYFLIFIIKLVYNTEKCENLTFVKNRRFANNIGIKIKEMRRLKLHIPTNISFGAEMKFKIRRMIKYTDSRNAVSV